MAQVDLDPIESHGSMEMTTTNQFKVTKQRFMNSEVGENMTIKTTVNDGDD